MASNPLKRPSPDDRSPDPSAKRLHRPYHHQHRLVHPVQPGLLEPAITDETSVDTLLARSVGIALRDAGFDQADPVALDGLRNAAEEYFLHLSFVVRLSMTACRRTQPVATDFEFALQQNNIKLDSLQPVVKHRPAGLAVPELLPTPPSSDTDEAHPTLPFLSPELSGVGDHAGTSYVPKHFPSFPSRHTYKDTPVFPRRVNDPRKIRERATEEGRMGEEALRKLAAAAKDGGAMALGHREKKLWGRKNENAETMLEKVVKTFSKKAAALNKTEGDDGGKPKFELGPIVNCERGTWRKHPATGARKSAKPDHEAKDPHMARVENWAHHAAA